MVVFAIHWHESAVGVHVSPHPEPPSHLSPHPIHLGCPSALALSALFHALNLDWLSVSHMVIYARVQVQQPGIQPEEMNGVGDEAASQFSFGLPVYFKLMILFHTFTKTLGQRFAIFSSHWPKFIISINHCCSSEFLLQWFSWNQPYHLLSTSSNVSYS